MSKANRGEVWLVDLGFAAKTRPCLVLSAPAAEEDRALVTLVPHTTATRGTRFEVVLSIRFLRTGAFDAQNLLTVPEAKLLRRLGTLAREQVEAVESAVRKWLALTD